jgi:hypothetical protein
MISGQKRIPVTLKRLNKSNRSWLWELNWRVPNIQLNWSVLRISIQALVNGHPKDKKVIRSLPGGFQA